MVNKIENRKGILRIVEASIAIFIILAALLLLMSRGVEKSETDFNDLIVPILEEMAQDSSLRGEILSYNTSLEPDDVDNAGIINNLNQFIGGKITNPALNYSVMVCDLKPICSLDPYPDTEGNLYSAERVISTNITESEFSPKKVKIFLWKKS